MSALTDVTTIYHQLLTQNDMPRDSARSPVPSIRRKSDRLWLKAIDRCYGIAYIDRDQDIIVLPYAERKQAPAGAVRLPAIALIFWAGDDQSDNWISFDRRLRRHCDHIYFTAHDLTLTRSYADLIADMFIR